MKEDLVKKIMDLINEKQASSFTLPPFNNMIFENIPYVDDDLYEHQLDIIYPNIALDTYPFIINIHGGGFSMNSKDFLYREYALRLASDKYAVVNINYRLSLNYKFPMQLEDVLSVLKFIENNYTKYRLDINNMYFCGDSAGGYLVAMLNAIIKHPVLRAYYKCECQIKPKAIACNCGVFDFDTMRGKDVFFPLKNTIVFELFGSSKYQQMAAYQYSSVLKYVNADFGPTYILDTALASFEYEAYRLERRLQAFKVPYKIHIYPTKYGLEHVFNIKTKNPQSAIVLREMLAYFDKYLD